MLEITTSTGCLERERKALVHLKQGLKDPINPLSSWVGANCCRWAGIHCNNKTGHVVKLILRGPSEIQSSSPSEAQPVFESDFESGLVSLDLSYNHLQSPIPAALRNLCNLKTLNLWNFNLNGEINRFKESFKGCIKSNLEDLNLEGHGLSGHLPDWFGQFKNLRTLVLSNNSLSGSIPPSLGDIVNLNLDRNSLSCSILPSLGTLLSLEALNLHGNSLSGFIPPYLGSLSSLELLDLHSNKLNGSIPECLDNFRVKSILVYLSNWVPPFQLHMIGINDSKLGPQFPQLVQTQKQLVYLCLSNASISDAISNFFWNLSSSIKFLDLSSNSIFGSIFNCNAAKTTNLTYLSLSSNRLSESIPLSMCQMRTLTYLFLSNNLLTHEIPQCLGDLELVTLDLRNNFLSGSILSSLSKISKWIGERLLLLKFLILRSNKFDGSLPPQLSLLSELQVLDLSQNNLSGTIPKSFDNFSAMVVANRTNVFIDISGYYSGADLESIWEVNIYSRTLSLVININLSGNALHGEIPKEITHPFGLQSLNLSKNYLIGRIPRKYQ
ncbi:LRR receptor-like serine/threonine-protein kinase GSO1 [Cinnamomum micranthum f. kanehirae]|uniref:LRR receptor-like serine/threonine-protein kinase GSO1 n=1 Tax=Cinnamomum micranthum f. kanehirae TaxID=337451 RepID=A0A443PLZ1_9MAGN|nr:LRR receptor-like serine/threonine-protein kinase GSO1 [Cinnamomum micranthum f. kanehirae]